MKKAVKNIQGASLSRKYNKFMKQKVDSEKGKHSFSSRLSKSSRATKSAPANLASGNKHVKSRNYEIPRFAKPRKITLKHAIRLAKYAPLIQSAAKRHNVPVELICGVILQESGGNPRAKSHCGARGLMQLMPATARRFGVKDSYDPAQNIEGGTKYLRFLLDRFNGNLSLVCAGYNAGEGNVAKYGNKIPPFKETQNYVPAVLGYTQAMVDILSASRPAIASAELPANARRV